MNITSNDADGNVGRRILEEVFACEHPPTAVLRLPPRRNAPCKRLLLATGAILAMVGVRTVVAGNGEVISAIGSSVAVPVSHTPHTTYRSVRVNDLDIFYREAGPKAAPTVLLLHGFPTSSYMFRDLMRLLEDRYHVVAPDYPGFGFSSFPDPAEFSYSFEAFAHVIEKFTQAIGLDRYTLYIQDYGAPVGLRLALLHPERVTGLIVQNGNAYVEGLSPEWDAIKAYWREPSRENRERLRGWLNLEGTRLQYAAGLPREQVGLLSPDTWTLDWSRLARPGNIDMQLDLFGDYHKNVALYPRFQEFFRRYKPPTLIVWGRYDPFFTVAGARAYQRDLPDAQLYLLDAGHFAIETHGTRIAGLIREFLESKVVRKDLVGGKRS